MSFKRRFLNGAETLVTFIVATVLMSACSGGGGNSGSSSGSTGGTNGSTLAVFAGNMGGPGSADGTGAAAGFNNPSGVASDSAGNVYVADTANSTIRMITPIGIVTTLAGSPGIAGSTDGTGAAARFAGPSGVATDSTGNVYVADTGNSTIRKITPAGVVTTLAGTAGVYGHTDGTGAAASFGVNICMQTSCRIAGPSGIATDSASNVYVADTFNGTIRKITPAGVVTTLAGTAGVYGFADGTGAAASFGGATFLSGPAGLATDSANNVYVADTRNGTIRKITPVGVVTTLAGTAGILGSADGTGAAASFGTPSGVATDSTGNVYVADANGVIREITSAGLVTTLAGTASVHGHADGTGVAVSFNRPLGVATDNAGNVYVADGDDDNIRKISPAGVTSTLAGSTGEIGAADGIGAAARFSNPQGVASDNAGNVYVADTSNGAIRKITPAGAVTTLAGAAGLAGSADGIGAAARFALPHGVATDGAGNVYVADTDNQTVRKITPAGVVTTLAGTPGAFGSIDGTGAAAHFYSPWGVATDSAGSVYITDYNAIRKITSAGVVSTLAVSAPTFGNPSAVAIDAAGNVYVADNSTIRKIATDGSVTTLAGSTSLIGSADGTGVTARFNYPSGLATDSAGNVYVADTGNSTIRKITPAGVVTTVVGVAGHTGFVAGALPGGLSRPSGVAIRGTSLYVATLNGVAVVNNVP